MTPERILQAAFGFRASRVLLSALELGLFTELGKGPRSASQLCRSLGLSARIASRWLDVLVSHGFLERDGEGEGAIYLNSREASHFLDRNSAAYVGKSLEGVGGEVYAGWEALIRALRSGEESDAWTFASGRGHAERG
jgi:DNA-binding transcriptional ArsR family regulator